MTRLLIALSLVALALGACKKDDKKPAEDQAAQAGMNAEGAGEAQPTDAPDPSAEAEAEEELPVETDFEDEAESDITTDNYKEELAKLTKEIEADE